MHTVDYKCELRDRTLAEGILRASGCAHLATVVQTDTYFRVPDATLVRRQTSGGPAEWVFFTRPRGLGPRLASATVYSEASARARFGSGALPVWVIVQKERAVWLRGDVRVMLDEVAGLGKFVEFEARVGPRATVARRRHDIWAARTMLTPALGEPIGCGYADLMAREQAHVVGRALPPGA